MNRQSMFDTAYRMLGAGARGRSREMIWGRRWERGSGLGTHVHPWQIHVNVWQNQYSTVKQNEVKIKIKKNLPAMQEALVLSLGCEDPLEKGKATCSSILAWRIPWTVPRGHKRVGHD